MEQAPLLLQVQLATLEAVGMIVPQSPALTTLLTVLQQGAVLSQPSPLPEVVW